MAQQVKVMKSPAQLKEALANAKTVDEVKAVLADLIDVVDALADLEPTSVPKAQESVVKSVRSWLSKPVRQTKEGD